MSANFDCAPVTAVSKADLALSIASLEESGLLNTSFKAASCFCTSASSCTLVGTLFKADLAASVDSLKVELAAVTADCKAVVAFKISAVNAFLSATWPSLAAASTSVCTFACAALTVASPATLAGTFAMASLAPLLATARFAFAASTAFCNVSCAAFNCAKETNLLAGSNSLSKAAWDSATEASFLTVVVSTGVAFKAFLAASMAWFATSTASLTAFFAASICEVVASLSANLSSSAFLAAATDGSATIPAASGLFKSSTTP